MDNIKKFIFFIFLLFLFFPWFILAAEKKSIDLYFFEGQGCQHCAKIKSYLEGLKQDYPTLNVYDFEVYFDAEGQALFHEMAEAYDADIKGVPTIFIDNEVIVGENFEKLKNAIERCSQEVCVSPMNKIQQKNANTNNVNEYVDGFSPPTSGVREIVGWIIIGILVVVGLILLIFIFKKRNRQAK